MTTTTMPTVARAAVERPILFQGEMIRSYQQGRKTQTRRTRGLEEVNQYPDSWDPMIVGVWLDRFAVTFRQRFGDERTITQFCPYGRPGDVLWARETWRWIGEHNHQDHRAICWRADRDDWPSTARWRPSIFMPRWASRYTLPVLDIRCERIQDISEADAQCEGWDLSNLDLRQSYDPVTMNKAREWFFKKWDEINAKRGMSKERNPWVWVVSFPAYTG